MSRSRTLVNACLLAAFTLLCVGGMEYLALNIGQHNPFSTNYQMHAVFSDADGVPTSADVRLSGIAVGKVVEVTHDPAQPGYSVVTMEITDPVAAPVYSDGTVRVRPKTLLGEKYVDLTVGNANTAERIPSGGYLPRANASKDVSDDEIFNAFDARTRAQQQQVIQQLDVATRGRAGDVQQLLPQLQSVLANLEPVAQVYGRDAPQVNDIFVQLNTIMRSLADEHQQLAGLLANGNVTLSAIASRDQSLLTTLQEAANVSNEFNTAMSPTVAAQRQALSQLAPTFDSQSRLLDAIIGPQSSCGGQSCGIDKVLTGTLIGQIHYPNDQLTVTTPAGETVSKVWDSMFSVPTSSFESGSPAGSSSPSASHSALNISISFHCDTLSRTLDTVLPQLPQAAQDLIQQECAAVTSGQLPTPSVPGGALPGPAVPHALPGALLAGSTL